MSTLPVLSRITLTEARLFSRDPMSMVIPLLLPVVLLLAWGSVAGMREPAADLGGQRPLDVVIAPIAILVAVGTLGVSTLPVYLASYREKGVLRRLSTTPVHPGLLLAAQLVVHLVVAVLAVAVALGVGVVVFDVALPQHPVGFAASLVLGIAALFALGLLIAALAPRSSAATTIGSIALFPMMLLGGVFVPLEQLPDVVGRIGVLTPLGAALQTVRDTWAGSAPDLLHLAVLVAWVVLCGALAARWFRWE